MSDYVTPHAESAALLTIDLQRDFSLRGAADEIPGTAKVLSQAGKLAAAFRCHKLPILHAVRLYRENGSNADACRRQAIEEGLRLVVPGSEGAELVDEIKPTATVKHNPSELLAGKFQKIGAAEWIFYKPRWGAFYATSLEGHLRQLGIDTLVICGCNFPNCPRATIIEASERDFRLLLVLDAVSAIYESGIAELTRIGVTVKTSAQTIFWLDARP
jgi:nicotinamidase-related amidase